VDNSFHEEGSCTQPGPKRFQVSLLTLKNLIHWLAGLFQWTEEEQQEAGIYLDRPGGE
jgi:hypothetical protein